MADDDRRAVELKLRALREKQPKPVEYWVKSRCVFRVPPLREDGQSHFRITRLCLHRLCVGALVAKKAVGDEGGAAVRVIPWSDVPQKRTAGGVGVGGRPVRSGV